MQAPPERVRRELEMNPTIVRLEKAALKKDLTPFNPGDTIRVNVRLKEGAVS